MAVRPDGGTLDGTKKNVLLSHGKTWRNRKNILLSERSHLKRLRTVRFQLCDILEKAELWEQEKDQGPGQTDE